MKQFQKQINGVDKVPMTLSGNVFFFTVVLTILLLSASEVRADKSGSWNVRRPVSSVAQSQSQRQLSTIASNCTEPTNALSNDGNSFWSRPVATCNEGVIDVPFNSRSYFYDNVSDEDRNSNNQIQCEAAFRLPFDLDKNYHHQDENENEQQCSSVTTGAFFLAGKTLSYDVDLSRTSCGCNAAMYLVDMPSNIKKGTCGDYYCDANSICGVACTEIDLMEANLVAFKTVVHHGEDLSGEQYGHGRWMSDEKSFYLSEDTEGDWDCFYGPSQSCAINTLEIFHASFSFSDSNESFGMTTRLQQDERSILSKAIKYTTPSVSSATNEAISTLLGNVRLKQSVETGMTLVASYWGGPNVDSLSWLDAPCKEPGCSDVFTGKDWPWMCTEVDVKTDCSASYRFSNLEVSTSTSTSTFNEDVTSIARSSGLDTFFISNFDPPLKAKKKEPLSLGERFVYIRDDPLSFFWTPLDHVFDWIVVILFIIPTFILNVYSLVRLTNIFRALWATKIFLSKPNVGGKIEKGHEPMVTLQICCYNEGNVIEETINAACSVDWPKDKLVVQVLDDSNDESVEIIAKVCKRWREYGFECHRLLREDRIGYKAGNLQSHFGEIKGDFVGLFDSDHRCDRDFLRRCIPHFYSKEGEQKLDVGLVQCPWAYYNVHSNILTQYDALNLDSSFVIEQTARHAKFGCFSFNGTGGIWRKDAIAAAGGWSWQTVTEDLYISCKAHLSGYNFVYLRDLPQVLEVPAGIRAHLLQKNRWTKGYWQTTRLTLKKIFHDPNASTMLKLEVFFQYTASIMYACTFALVLLAPFMTYRELFSPFLICLTLSPAFIALVACVCTIFGKDAGNHHGNYRILLARILRLRFIPFVFFFALGVMVFECFAIFQGITSNDATFLRTPKEGAQLEVDEVGDQSDRPAPIQTERIDYGARLQNEEYDDHMIHTDEEHRSDDKESDCCSCFSIFCQQSTSGTQKRRLRSNVLVGIYGILVACYLLAAAIFISFTQTNESDDWVDYLVTSSLCIPSLALFSVHGAYLLRL